MTFIDTLRQARESRVAVLHEFWTQYDPRQTRVHAFFEGHDDIAFIAPHIERHLPAGYRLMPYRCEGKARVYEAFSDITGKRPDVRLVLFFVDKDLDDILGTPWPTDPRIYVTDVYSVENYVVDQGVLRRMLRDGVRLTGVAYDEEAIIREFDRSLQKYQGKILTIMAWVLLARRYGQRPNLNNLGMRALWSVGDDCALIRVQSRRVNVLSTATGVILPSPSHAQLRRTRRELERVPVKRVIRGKFELWYFVEFWRVLLKHLATLTAETGGKMQVKLTFTHENGVRVAAPYVEAPESLDRFLRAHLAPTSSRVRDERGAPRGSIWRRLLGFVRLS